MKLNNSLGTPRGNKLFCAGLQGDLKKTKNNPEIFQKLSMVIWEMENNPKNKTKQAKNTSKIVKKCHAYILYKDKNNKKMKYSGIVTIVQS